MSDGLAWRKASDVFVVPTCKSKCSLFGHASVRTRSECLQRTHFQLSEEVPTINGDHGSSSWIPESQALADTQMENRDVLFI